MAVATLVVGKASVRKIEFSHTDSTFNERDMCRQSVEILDIGWAATCYFLMAIATTAGVNKLASYLNPQPHTAKSTQRLLVEIILYLWLLCVCTLIVRNINVFLFIPTPLHGVCGHNHFLVKEINGAVVYWTVLTRDSRLQTQISLLTSRLNHCN